MVCVGVGSEASKIDGDHDREAHDGSQTGCKLRELEAASSGPTQVLQCARQPQDARVAQLDDGQSISPGNESGKHSIAVVAGYGGCPQVES